MITTTNIKKSNVFVFINDRFDSFFILSLSLKEILLVRKISECGLRRRDSMTIIHQRCFTYSMFFFLIKLCSSKLDFCLFRIDERIFWCSSTLIRTWEKKFVETKEIYLSIYLSIDRIFITYCLLLEILNFHK